MSDDFAKAAQVAEQLIANAREELTAGPQPARVWEIMTGFLSGYEDQMEGFLYLTAALAHACAFTERDLQALSAVIPAEHIPAGDQGE